MDAVIGPTTDQKHNPLLTRIPAHTFLFDSLALKNLYFQPKAGKKLSGAATILAHTKNCQRCPNLANGSFNKFRFLSYLSICINNKSQLY